MSNDSQVTIGINMDHSVEGLELSRAALSLEYPTMDRDVGNALQFEIALSTLLRIVGKAILQCKQSSSEKMPIYKGLLDEFQKELDALQNLAG